MLAICQRHVVRDQVDRAVAADRQPPAVGAEQLPQIKIVLAAMRLVRQ
jgi:hypothetical protein